MQQTVNGNGRSVCLRPIDVDEDSISGWLRSEIA